MTRKKPTGQRGTSRSTANLAEGPAPSVPSPSAAQSAPSAGSATAAPTASGASNQTLSVTAGSLPPGLSTTDTGTVFTIEGNPAQQGTYTFTVTVQDSEVHFPPVTASATFTLVVP